MTSLGALLVFTHMLPVLSFAYAPNFITKIIQDQTGVQPHEAINGEELPLKIRTRFPPEPNGYLHLGHAKAVSFNFAVARMFGGVCHMRLDDTNPSKEDVEYVNSILEDVQWIQSGLYEKSGQDYPWDGPIRKTSDYFGLIYDCAVALIQSGEAYVDSLNAEEMREYRGTLTEPGRDSPHRTRSIRENLELFQGMRNGDFPDGAHILRAKIDMSSPNVNMRDPALYRIKHESHQETGDEWCIYPMYDFSHPIADAVEGITHSLCTLEFEDHRPFYDWTIEKLVPTGLITGRPQQIEFSRLNIQSTVLSKRKLIQLVQEGHVSGWDDPRMPTLSGIRRRGVPPEALRLFCERVGISKADSNIDFTNLEDCVRETMDAAVPRALGVLNPLKISISNWEDGIEEFHVSRHPKLEEMGKRVIPFGKDLFIERADFFDLDGPEGKVSNGKPPTGFKRLLPGGKVRLRYAYVIECNEVVRDKDTQEPIELKCNFFPNTRAGVTPDGMPRVGGIIHWVEASTAVSCTINQYDRLFASDDPGKESGDFLKDINPGSLEIMSGAVVEPSVASDANILFQEISSGAERRYLSSLAYQFERSGYFSLDKTSTGADNLIFNRVVTLRDTWAGERKEEGKRSRGSNRLSSANNEPVEDLRRIAVKAATILSADFHPEAANLLVFQVDCGDATEDGLSEPRIVVANLAGKVSMEDLVGRRVAVVANLKPAKMRGIESTAMLLSASDGNEGEEENVELLRIPDSVPNGELIYFEGKEPSEPDTMMKSKGALKAFDRVKACFALNELGEVIYQSETESYRMLTSGGPVKTSSLKSAIIQ
jgi:glutaminyl-tRNA synthetase